MEERVSRLMQELLADVLSDLQMARQDSGGRGEFDNLPTFDADKTQMRQLFQNLLSNALKFRKPDVAPLIKVTAEKETRLDDGGNDQEFWTFRLADNGIGFENEYKDQIFTIFKRLHGRFEYEGTGIGLATCRKIVERHNGHIDADGVPDVGATFIIQLPAEQTNQEELTQ